MPPGGHPQVTVDGVQTGRPYKLIDKPRPIVFTSPTTLQYLAEEEDTRSLIDVEIVEP